MLRSKQRLFVASAIAVLIVGAAVASSANSRPEEQQARAESSEGHGLSPALERTIGAAGERTGQEAAIPAQATEEQLSALYLGLADDFARRLANASAGEVVTSDPRRIGALY
jgi:hypothetical protein